MIDSLTVVHADGPILAVRVEDLGEKEAVLAAQPKAFFTIPHFDGVFGRSDRAEVGRQTSIARSDHRRLAGMCTAQTR
jgi:hypothetical protein